MFENKQNNYSATPNSPSTSISPYLIHDHCQLDHSTSQIPHNDLSISEQAELFQ